MLVQSCDHRNNREKEWMNLKKKWKEHGLTEELVNFHWKENQKIFKCFENNYSNYPHRFICMINEFELKGMN